MSDKPDTPYMPQANSLPALVVAYFARLPEEELSTADISIKWQTEKKNLEYRLRYAVVAGLLARDGTVYSAGPNIGRFSLNTAVTLQSQSLKKRGHFNEPPAIDMDSITFEEGVKLDPVKGDSVRRADQWKTKLLTMAPGQSFPVDKAHRTTIAPAMTALRKQGLRYAMRSVDLETVRVFCLELEKKA